MAIDLKRFERIKDDVEKKQREVNRAEGSLSTQMTRLKQDFKCETLEQAEELLEKIKTKMERVDKQFQEKMEEFDEEWSGKLDE